MPSLRPRRPRAVNVLLMMCVLPSELDLDIDTSRQIEAHERVDRLRRGIDDVNEPLVSAHFKMLAAVFVLVRRTDHTEHVLLRWQWHWASHTGAGTGHGVDDLFRRRVNDLVVVGLEPDTDFLSRHALARPLRFVFASLPPGWETVIAPKRTPRSGVSRCTRKGHTHLELGGWTGSG